MRRAVVVLMCVCLAAASAFAQRAATAVQALDATRSACVITDWRVAGPFGKYANVAYEREFAPERDGLLQAAYDGRAVETLRFFDGEFRLPDYLLGDGVFYATADFSVARAEQYTVRVESAGTLDLFVDGARVITKDDRLRERGDTASAQVALRPGSHRLLVKFIGTALPFRVAVASAKDVNAATFAHGRSSDNDPLEDAETLADQGRHAEAARAAERVVKTNPYDRNARALAAREWAMAGDRQRATTAARELAALAPNSAQYREMAERIARGATLVDAVDSRGRDFGAAHEFYRPYRRDGAAVVREAAGRRFSGRAVYLLNEKVVRVERDGSAVAYVHRVTRVLNRDGVLAFGEVRLPPDAEVLELRTIKADGTLAEPEFSRNKLTISMPALAPGDAIDEEFVVRYDDVRAHPEALQFLFASNAAPMLVARFVVLTPADTELRDVSTKGVPATIMHREHETTVRMWERKDAAQFVDEIAATADAAPVVQLVPATTWDEIRDACRAVLMDRVRAGRNVRRVAAQFNQRSEEERARAIYAFVKTKVRGGGAAFPASESAENTLARYAGSRTAAVMALARATGLKADLVMARNVGAGRAEAASTLTYTRPLVRFTFAEGARVVDAESEGLAFGALPPTVERGDALLVPVEATDENTIAALPVGGIGGQNVSEQGVHEQGVSEQSIAEADVTVGADGSLRARVRVQMGSWRAVQMRAVLAGIDASQRPNFFEQLAARIFPGATDAEGRVENEGNVEAPLVLSFTCRAVRFVNFHGRSADLDQMVPALGLRRMYVGQSARTLPLLIDVPLVESAVFRVHLPPDVTFTAPDNLRLHSEFGDYALTFSALGAGQVEIRRVFNIPVQVVVAERFGEFAEFARRIDDAERMRMLLTRVESGLRAAAK